MSKSVLVIDDEERISRLLQLELSHEGYEVEIAHDGREGLELALGQSWDIIILDIMMPGLNGVEVLRRLRKADETTPVILVTARNTTPDIVSGLDQGANDYITKPFEIEELLARIRAHIRTPAGNSQLQGEESPVIEADNLTINKQTRDVTRGEQRIELTPKEFDLLVYMIEHKNHVLSREQIIKDVWDFEFVGDTNVVDVYIRYLRQKIDKGHKKKLIKTSRGIGYSIREEDD
ncbi:DNA-binding response regulator [Bacillus sp. FJAT-27264]|uniref:response regulator transcription factor n=1 Tax=Paenibacillus sp. (strain DSM 101736 / FJAT-27264) TaxID=1850362 RepID=UPI000807B694|nr:response regulator transcription factor [Bacillus sp. FJAT-27264]OBZ14255.1 DNA-binding response regulator [Bacillus sp. FJAT-27264]